MFTEMLGPVIDKYLNHYRQNVVIQSPIRGQEDKADMFTFDFRNTHDPIHDTDSVSFMFIGELFYKWSPCHRFSTTDITRLSIQESYLAITPGAAECIAEQIAQTRIGRYDMTQSNLEILFGNYDWKVHANQDLGEYDVTAGWTVRTETPQACMARCLR